MASGYDSYIKLEVECSLVILCTIIAQMLPNPMALRR